MSENTKIAWATHTFNPWIGCSRVHAGCTNCYAEAMSGRLGVTWGMNGTRRRTAESTWKQVEKWNRKASDYVERPRVFPSLCDPFEDWGGVIQGTAISTFNDVRREFFALIDQCHNLDFLLLTKRPESILGMWPSAYWMMDGGGRKRDNVWLIYSASDQESLNAGLPHIISCRSLTPILGLSLEPLLGSVDLSGWLYPQSDTINDAVDWVIVGGESGPRHRPMCVSWIKSIADQCSAAGVPLFVKQDCGPKAGQQGRIPDHLWNRKEFPRVSNQP